MIKLKQTKDRKLMPGNFQASLNKNENGELELLIPIALGHIAKTRHLESAEEFLDFATFFRGVLAKILEWDSSDIDLALQDLHLILDDVIQANVNSVKKRSFGAKCPIIGKI